MTSGSHRFEVRAVDRNWNIDPTPARFEFLVLLPWYRETGFRIVGTLGLLALAGAIGLLATRHLRLERLVTERTSALADSNLQLRRELEDRERVEQERARLEAQLHQSQKLEAIGRLAGGIAHDFNNLLTVVWSYSELMRMQLPADSPLVTPAVEIARAAERAAALTRQLLAFGRHQVIRPEVLDLNEVVGDIERMLRRLIGEDIDLEWRPGPNLWGVMADRGQLEQVIVNLAVNARDAMPDGGRLTIETSNTEVDDTFARVHVGVQPGAYVVLAVSDTGVGMNVETRSPPVRAVLHDQGPRTGHRARACHGLRHRRPGRRPHLGIQRARTRGDVHDLSAARRSRAPAVAGRVGNPDRRARPRSHPARRRR